MSRTTTTCIARKARNMLDVLSVSSVLSVLEKLRMSAALEKLKLSSVSEVPEQLRLLSVPDVLKKLKVVFVLLVLKVFKVVLSTSMLHIPMESTNACIVNFKTISQKLLERADVKFVCCTLTFAYINNSTCDRF